MSKRTKKCTRNLLNYLIVVIFFLTFPLFARVIALAPDGIDNGKDHPDLSEGYWGPKTATVNWCEHDYAVVHYIAEFGNTVSSLIIILTGIYCFVMHNIYQRRIEPRFGVAFLFFVMVGAGSAFFHATLWRSMQLSDELPMLWANSVFIFIVVTMEDPPKRERLSLILGLVFVTCFTTALVALFDKDDQNIFLISYGSGVVFLFVKSRGFNRKYNAAQETILLELSAVFYGIGLLSWLMDRTFCHRLRSLHLHSVWHLCADLGTSHGVMFWVWCRAHVLHNKPFEAGWTYFDTYISVV